MTTKASGLSTYHIMGNEEKTIKLRKAMVEKFLRNRLNNSLEQMRTFLGKYLRDDESELILPKDILLSETGEILEDHMAQREGLQDVFRRHVESFRLPSTRFI